jgi:sulfur-oxidizing protein SoxY
MSAAAAVGAVLPAGAPRASNGAAEAIAAFTGGAVPRDGGVRIEAPEIADNGGAVPIRVEAEGARRIALFADGNPNPGVARFAFGALTPPAAKIRIRLAESQNVIAVAEMADGTFRRVSRRIAVTVGGCA